MDKFEIVDLGAIVEETKNVRLAPVQDSIDRSFVL